MTYLLYLFSIILIQKTTAQIFTVAGNNLIPNLCNQNIASNIPLTTGLGLGNGIALANIGQTGAIELANIQRNAPTGNIGNANLENFYIPNGNVNQGFGNSNNLVSNIGNANIGLAKSGNANNYANIGFTNNAANNVANIGLANNVANNVANTGFTNNVASNVANIGLTNNANIANVDSNVKASCSNNANVPISNYANIVKPPREYGIEFGADALEVNGAVQVSGRMPFNANVAVQGSVPAQGQGTVSYKCDKMSADDS